MPEPRVIPKVPPDIPVKPIHQARIKKIMQHQVAPAPEVFAELLAIHVHFPQGPVLRCLEKYETDEGDCSSGEAQQYDIGNADQTELAKGHAPALLVYPFQ